MSEWTYNGVEFKVGDKVKIVRQVESLAIGGMGDGKAWKNSWASSMSDSIGNVAEITSISILGAKLSTACFGWPLAALEKQEVALPAGIFKLVDKAGVVYDVTENFASYYSVTYPGPVPRTVAYALVDRKQIIEYIENGFWCTARSADLKKKEAELTELIEQQDILTNEIKQLEGEIAQW